MLHLVLGSISNLNDMQAIFFHELHFGSCNCKAKWETLKIAPRMMETDSTLPELQLKSKTGSFSIKLKWIMYSWIIKYLLQGVDSVTYASG